MRLITQSLLLFFALTYQSVSAFAGDDIDESIQQLKVMTYDCPAAQAIDSIEELLANPAITDKQRYALSVEKTHWQICMGKHQSAEESLKSLVAESTHQNSEFFAAALYQLGFIYDVQENPKRCEYYQRAKSKAEDRFTDVDLSASLGLITVCNKQNDNGIKLGRLYALLEKFMKIGDNGATAHIHNNIGLLYGALGQHVLAAEQYQKAYEIGLGAYTGTNQLSTLVSVITSQMASGDYPQVKQSIKEMKRVNSGINTPMTNNWVHFSEAGYHYRLGNAEELRNSLARWKVYIDQINSQVYTLMYRWYSAGLCLLEKDVDCLNLYLLEQQQASAAQINFLSGNQHYLKLQVDIHLFLGNIEQAHAAFEQFSELMMGKLIRQQASGRVLGVANLHNQVLALETSLAAEKSRKNQFVMLIVVTFVLFLAAICYFLRRRYLNSQKYDQVTSLLNSKAAVSKIKRVDAPSKGRTNAIALFDLGNFRDVNRMIGSVNSDLALEQIAKTLVNITRSMDIVGRFAPEQFIVCLTDIEEDSAKSFFERIRFAMENTMLGEEQGQKVSIRSSMSIYLTSDAFSDLSDVLDDMQMSLSLQTASDLRHD